MNGRKMAILLGFLGFVFVLLCIALHFRPARGAIAAIKSLVKNKKTVGEA